MINMSRALKIASAWISVVYLVCFGSVALFPGIREGFMRYALHAEIELGSNVMTLTTFITGFIIWNVVAVLAVGLFVALNNYFNQNI